MQIREMLEEDINKVAELERQNFSSPWSEGDFLLQLSNPHAYYLIVESEGEIIGVCGYLESFQEGELYNVSVAKERQGEGIGLAMLQALLKNGTDNGVHAFTLEVRVSNQKAISLYRKLGFVQEGLRKGFYERPKEDAIIMWKR